MVKAVFITLHKCLISQGCIYRVQDHNSDLINFQLSPFEFCLYHFLLSNLKTFLCLLGGSYRGAIIALLASSFCSLCNVSCAVFVKEEKPVIAKQHRYHFWLAAKAASHH